TDACRVVRRTPAPLAESAADVHPTDETPHYRCVPRMRCAANPTSRARSLYVRCGRSLPPHCGERPFLRSRRDREGTDSLPCRTAAIVDGSESWPLPSACRHDGVSGRKIAAINVEFRAGDIRRLVRGEEQDGVCDFVHLTCAAQRHTLQHLCPHFGIGGRTR